MLAIGRFLLPSFGLIFAALWLAPNSSDASKMENEHKQTSFIVIFIFLKRFDLKSDPCAHGVLSLGTNVRSSRLLMTSK